MNIAELSALLAAVIYLFLGLFVYSRNRRNILNISFFLYFLSLFVWSFGIFGVVFSDESNVALIWIRILNIGLVFLPSTCLSFIFSFLRNISRNKNFITKIVYLYSFAYLIISFTSLFTKSAKKIPFGFVADPGPLFNVFVPITLFILVYGHLLLLREYKITKGYRANQIKYLFFGTVIMIIGQISVLPSILGKVILRGFPVWNFTSIAYGCILFYAIFRHHLMGINIIIKKTAIYSTVIALVAGGYLSIISVFDYVFQTLIGHGSVFGRIIAVIVIAIIFQPLRNKIEAFVDKIFFRTKYDYQQTLLTFSQSLTSILDLRELLDLITKVICTTLKTNKVSIMLRQQNDKIVYGVVSSIGLPQDCRQWQFTQDSKLLTWVEKEKGLALRESFCHQQPLPLYYFKIVAEMRLLKSAVAIPLFHKQELIGILNIGEKISGDIYSKEDIELLHNLGNEAAVAIANAHLYNDLQQSYLQTIQALAQAIEANDEYTRGHSDRVTILAMETAREMKIDRQAMETLKYACILHDVGKIAIMKEVLNKPGKLTDAEFAIIKLHPEKGEEIIAPVGFLKDVRPVIRHHHERYDGKGYPDGLDNGKIPLLSRIIAVADTFDAMTSHRPYRPALSAEAAAAELLCCAGTQFDPKVVDAFLKMYTTKP